MVERGNKEAADRRQQQDAMRTPNRIATDGEIVGEEKLRPYAVYSRYGEIS